MSFWVDSFIESDNRVLCIENLNILSNIIVPFEFIEIRGLRDLW